MKTMLLFNFSKYKINLFFFLLLIVLLAFSCKENEPTKPEEKKETRSDTQLIVDKYTLPAGETEEFPAGFEIIASEGMEINGDILCKGDFILTANNGDIVISGNIMLNDTSFINTLSRSNKKLEKTVSQIDNNQAADGFSHTVNAVNGNIILQKGATIFSGRGQHASDETLNSISGPYEGAAGGNGGLIILNAPNGTVKLPNLGGNVIPFEDEVFVIGNGGDGANIILDENLEAGNLDVLEVRGGLGGNSGELIIDALEIEGIPSLEAMETHPDFIYGGEGGNGGYVIWDIAGENKKYSLTEIILHGGDGGNGARYGGNGGFAYFSPALFSIDIGGLEPKPFSEVGDPVANTFCYGGDGGDVFASPVPITQAYGGDGGEYAVQGVRGWNGDEETRDGADGGNALGQGGNGGNILEGVRAYQAVGGGGGNSNDARTYFPAAILSESDYLAKRYGVSGGYGGNGYTDCEGCPGGNGGNAGSAKAIGGKGGDVLSEAIESIGGSGGDTWAVSRGVPGDGVDGNPPGESGGFPQSIFSETPGNGGSGSSPGPIGEILGSDLEYLAIGLDGEYCGEDLVCEGNNESCYTQIGASFTAFKLNRGECYNHRSGQTRIRETITSTLAT